MDKLQGKLLDFLYLNSGSFITSADLSVACDVSSRTIKRRIQLLDAEVQNYGAEIESSKSGYMLVIKKQDDFSQYISQFKYQREVLGIEESDIREIVDELLRSKYKTQDELASTLFISRSTIGKLMNDVRETFAKFGIAVNHRPHYGYYLVGKEQVLRNYMVKFFLGEYGLRESQSEFSKSLIGQNEGFVDAIYQLLNNYQIFRFDNLLKEFVSFLLVSIFRNQQELFIETSIPIWEEYTPEKEEFLIKLFRIIYDRFHVTFNHGDRNYLLSLMNNESNNESNSANDEFIDTVVDRFLEEIERVYGEDFKADEVLRRGLIQHLHATYSRLYINAMVTNPLIAMIKSSYIESYNYAILCGEVMKNEFQVTMSEDDIGYIALHFAAMRERLNLGKNFNAILVCGSGIGTAELLKVRLSSEIPSLRVVKTCFSNELQYPVADDISLIISTVPLDKSVLNRPMIQVSALIQSYEIDMIKDYLKNYQNAHMVKDSFSEELFFPKMKFSDKGEVMTFISRTLKEKGIISDEENTSLLEREIASSTEINENVALPHCIVSHQKKCAFMIITLEKPVHWGRIPVQLIIVAVIAKGTSINRVIFPLVYRITNDREKVMHLLSIVSFKPFVDAMFSDIPVDFR